jgi:hypothetical protein
MKKPRRRIQKPRAEAYTIDSDAIFSFIAGYTSGGAPYGATWEEVAKQERRETERQEKEDKDWGISERKIGFSF